MTYMQMKKAIYYTIYELCLLERKKKNFLYKTVVQWKKLTINHYIMF